MRNATRARKRIGLALVVALAFWAGWRGYRAHVSAPYDEIAHAATWTQGTRFLARDGQLLGERASAEGLTGRALTLDEVSERLVKATIESEDRRWESHDGVDPVALARAFVSLVRHRHAVSGASTISQQLVKRLDHHGKPHPRTFATKLLEMARAQNLEARFDKRTLLEAYFNHIDYGHGWAGPEAAAQGYFGARARDLSLAQAALLAVLPRAPSALDPYRHPERAFSRQRALLGAMRAHGVISQADLERALAEGVTLRPPHAAPGLVAPHVVLARQVTEEKEIVTTIDFGLQRDVDALVRTHAKRMASRGASTAAVVVVDNATGDVIAEVGSADYYDAKIAGAVDLVRARRQPGSTLKPFIYARSFERGVSPMAPLADVPTELGANDRGTTWSPENFDGSFVGPVSAREALAGSLNVPAVRLAQGLGASELVATLRRVGLRLPEGAAHYGLSIALGSGEVTALELTEAYVTLARGGEHVNLRTRKTDPIAAPERVLDAAAVAAVADALSDPVARIRGLRTRGPFEFPYPVAVKTGTSTAFRDAWSAGFTRERTVVVWIGNADGSATNKLTGAVGAGPLFFEIMKRAMAAVPARAPLYAKELLVDAEICPLSGERPGPACTDRVHRFFPRGQTPSHECPLHRRAAEVAVTPAAQSGWRCAADGTKSVVVLPEPYRAWLSERAPGAPGADVHGLPWLLASDVAGCAPAIAEVPRVVVLSPRDGSVIEAERSRAASHDAIDVAAEAHGLGGRAALEVLIDGRVASRLEAPYRARIGITRGDHTVEIRPANTTVAALLGRSRISVR